MITYNDTMILHAERVTAISETDSPVLFTRDGLVRVQAELLMNESGITGSRIKLTGGIAEAIRERMRGTRDPLTAARDAFMWGYNGAQGPEITQDPTFALVLTTITRDETGKELARLSWRFDGSDVKADEQGNPFIESMVKPGKPVLRIDAE